MTAWYYMKARKLSDNSFIGWVGWSAQGVLRFNGTEGEDPSKDSSVAVVGLFEHNGATYLRAPAYHAHGSASLGGSGDNGYYAVWHWGETSGYKVTRDARGVLKDDNGRVLSLYVYASFNDGTWEANEKEAVILELSVPAK